MNAPNRSDSYQLPVDGKKLTYEKDTKIPHAGLFKILREDHTIGNLLRMQLLRDEAVLFAGYQHPHPLIHDITVRVQTNDQSNPVEALSRSIEQLTQELANLKQKFKKSIDQHKQSQEDSAYS